MQLTARDLYGLQFVAQMGAVRFDQLGQLFAPDLSLPQQQEPAERAPLQHGGNRMQQQWPTDHTSRIHNVYRIVSRWEELGYAKKKKAFADQPTWVWVTTGGMKALHLSYKGRFPQPGELEHIYQVNRVRLQLARSALLKSPKVPQHTWISERQIIALEVEKRPRFSDHRPDGILQLAHDVHIAVEVELSSKSYKRLDAILYELATLYPRIAYGGSLWPGVWYFVSEATCATIEKARAQLEVEQQETIALYIL